MTHGQVSLWYYLYIFDTKYDTIKNVYIDFKVWKSKKVLHF